VGSPGGAAAAAAAVAATAGGGGRHAMETAASREVGRCTLNQVDP
jgi:hypothetical protein